MNSGSKTPLIIAVAIVMVGGAVAYFLMSNSEKPLTPSSDKPSIQTPLDPRGLPQTGESATLPPPVRPVPTPPPVSTLPKPQRPGAKAREIIAELRSGERKIDLSEIFRQATHFQQNGAGTDAHLLYFFAARNGHPGSMFALAGTYDPLYFQSGQNAMDEPTPDQAHKWYGKALEAGNEEARKRLSALKRWVADAAAQGDRDAQQLLERW